MVMRGPSSAPTQIAVLDGVLLEPHAPTEPGVEGADLWARNPPKGSCRSMGSEVGVLGVGLYLLEVLSGRQSLAGQGGLWWSRMRKSAGGSVVGSDVIRCVNT